MIELGDPLFLKPYDPAEKKLATAEDIIGRYRANLAK